jgi:hypothetical protein
MLVEAGKIEGAGKPVDEVEQDVAAEDRRGAAAPVQVDDASRADGAADEIDFRPEETAISDDRASPANRFGRAPAVRAEFTAVGNVQIKR